MPSESTKGQIQQEQLRRLGVPNAFPFPDRMLETVIDEPKVEYVTGYPFMQLARRHGVDYGNVLMATRFVDESAEIRKLAHDAINRLGVAAIHELGELLKQPPWLRGAVGHDVV